MTSYFMVIYKAQGKLKLNMDMDNPPTTISKFTPTKRLNKRQKDFIEYWLDSDSETFGNTYQSAIKAGFSDYSARVLTSNSHDVGWVKEAKNYLNIYTPSHIISAMQSIAHNAKQDRDRLRGLELLAKIQGLFIERSQSEVRVQFTNAVPRPTQSPSNGFLEGEVSDTPPKPETPTSDKVHSTT